MLWIDGSLALGKQIFLVKLISTHRDIFNLIFSIVGKTIFLVKLVNAPRDIFNLVFCTTREKDCFSEISYHP